MGKTRGTVRYGTYRGNHRAGRAWIWVAAVAAVLAVGGVFSWTARQIPAGTQTFPEPNHQHVTGQVVYDRTPPAGGAHSDVWLNCGIYDQPVPDPEAVHSLEHGAVWVTYQPSMPSGEVSVLRNVVATHYHGPQRYIVLSPYPGDPSLIVVSAWGAQLRLQSANDPRLVRFIDHFAGGAQGGEPGGPCTGGDGAPIG